MIRLVLVIWLAWSSFALAAPVMVKSGEHEGFTRLVLDFGAPVDWNVGRTLDGYELRLNSASPRYDLTEVFALIGKGRLAAIWVDPAAMSLRIGIACACHAIPFEFRPGIVVIDLRDGAPPKGSSFEQTLDGTKPPALAEKPTPRPRQRPGAGPTSYVWTDIAADDLPQMTQSGPPPALTSDPALEPLRESLLRQLSKGATQGVVDLALPDLPPVTNESHLQLPAVRIGLGELPGLTVGTGQPDHTSLGGKGEVCTDAESLDIASWGSDAPVSEQFSGAMAGLIGEFDKPDAVALERAVKFQLFLGFGAEARQLLRAFPADLPDAQLWSSLASILDDEPDTGPAFLGQSACGTPAALWSMLALPPPKKGDAVDRDAVLLAFSALPLALRRHLGPRLADRFFDLDDAETAGAIRNAILRAPGNAGPGVALLEAEIEMTNGNAAGAELRLDIILADSGPGTPAALVALVAARVAQDLPIESAHVVALESILTEQAGGTAEPDLRNALVLAQAASGDFAAAFAGLPQSPEAEPDVWRLLARIGIDDAVLAHAVLATDQTRPQVAPDTAALLAERLLGFGLAVPAQLWLGQTDNADLQARVHLARHDARSALSVLAGSNTESTPALRAEAMRMLRDQGEAQAYEAAGDAEGQRLALSKGRNWEQLAEMEVAGWSPVITTLADLKTEAPLEPLARGHQLAQYSVDTRSAVMNLLATVHGPTKPTP